MKAGLVVATSSSDVAQAFRSRGFADSFRVSKLSTFLDDVYDYNDETNPRLARFEDSNQLRIFWAGDQCPANCVIPPLMLKALRTFAVLHHIEPGTVVPSSAGTNSPVTVCQTMTTFLAFLGHLLHTCGLEISFRSKYLSFASVTVTHLDTAIKSWGKSNQDRIKRVLNGLTSVVLREMHPEIAPTWTSSDIGQLKFVDKERSDKDYVLPNPLFRLLSNAATERVCGFIEFLGRESICGVPGKLPHLLEPSRGNGAVVLADFIAIRHQRKHEERGLGPRVSDVCSQTLKTRFIQDYGFNPQVFLNYLYEVSNAACTIIALYTGCRYSDLRFFKVGCVRQIGGQWFLMGTHIKHQPIDKPVDTDTWPAIPVMRDAINVLEELKRLSLNPNLLSSLRTAGGKTPYSSSGLVNALARFLEVVDTERTWKGLILSTQRFRNTLAHQLARADVGLVFISRHLKHLHTSLTGKPAEVTLGYGNIKALKMERAVQAQSLRKDVARSLYDPDSPLAGGGGAAFDEARRQFFQGRLAAGYTKVQILDELAAAGNPFSSVGPGLCTGRKEIVNKDGSKRKPPCVGSLQCSPNDCHNAIITVVHVHLWRKVARQNADLAKRPDMAYAREEHLGKVEIAEGVLRKLGEPV